MGIGSIRHKMPPAAGGDMQQVGAQPPHAGYPQRGEQQLSHRSLHRLGCTSAIWQYATVDYQTYVKDDRKAAEHRPFYQTLL